VLILAGHIRGEILIGGDDSYGLKQLDACG
jgi:hypothetical protein